MSNPYTLLPTPEPRTVSPPPHSFYYNVSKWLIKDIIRIMHNGIPIDLEKVRTLEQNIDKTLSQVEQTLATNPYVKKYLSLRRSKQKEELVKEAKIKMKSYKDFLKPFDPSNIIHRSYYVKEVIGIVPTGEEILPGVPKWTVNDIKKYQSVNDCDFSDLLAKEPNKDIAEKAMLSFAKDKAYIYNKQYGAIVRHTNHFIPREKFNPGSADQKHQLLTDLLGLESDKKTDAWEKYEKECDIHWKRGYDPSEIEPPKNKYSWNRDNIKNQLELTEDPALQSLLQALIDFSYGAIIKNSFIPAFYNYTIDGTLYGSLRLAGTKTFRLTGNSPNLLQLPSTGSIYSSPVKECFIAPKGYVILAIDYAALT